MTGSTTPSRYVPGTHPDLPPPRRTTGVVGWVYKNLFSTPLNVALTLVGAYVLSHRTLPGRNLLLLIVLLTILFHGGMIPTVKDSFTDAAVKKSRAARQPGSEPAAWVPRSSRGT